MADEVVEYCANILPNLPSRDDIVISCAAAGYARNGVCIEAEGGLRLWTKYGVAVTAGEGHTQAQVAGIVNNDPASVFRVPDVYLMFSRGSSRYIVMQFVEGQTVANRKTTMGEYTKDDLKAVADAVKKLTTFRLPPDTQPGHIGGGPIGHDFFDECRSTIKYRNVKHLQDHVNNLIRHRGLTVDFLGETEEGLVLCPSDVDDSNFIFDTMGTLWVIDFGRTGYMPPSFVYYSLMGWKPFTQLVARRVQYPQSPNLYAMRVAAGLLTISGNNSLQAAP